MLRAIQVSLASRSAVGNKTPDIRDDEEVADENPKIRVPRISGFIGPNDTHSGNKSNPDLSAAGGGGNLFSRASDPATSNNQERKKPLTYREYTELLEFGELDRLVEFKNEIPDDAAYPIRNTGISTEIVFLWEENIDRFTPLEKSEIAATGTLQSGYADSFIKDLNRSRYIFKSAAEFDFQLENELNKDRALNLSLFEAVFTDGNDRSHISELPIRATFRTSQERRKIYGNPITGSSQRITPCHHTL